jgi:aldose 1-epimerase
MLHKKSAVDVLTLTHGQDRCDLIPEIGGAIAAWSVDGEHMMRPASAASVAAHDPFGMASFPLVPYSNRIGNGSFEWDGQRFALARNFYPEPHAIHGVGFERPWQVRARDANSATLTLNHRPCASWPFAFEAQQRITLGPGSLTIDMSAVNLAERAAPLAFGHHPYFPREGAWLKFGAESVWLVGDDGLPSLRLKPFGKFDYANGMAVTRGDIDHCFTDWHGKAEIYWPERHLAVQIDASESLRCAVVCIRSDVDGFCFEPVPHINNAANRSDRDHAMPVIAPGKSFTASIRLRAVNRAPGQ